MINNKIVFSPKKLFPLSILETKPTFSIGELAVRVSTFRAEGPVSPSLGSRVAKDPLDLCDLLGGLSRMIGKLIEGYMRRGTR